MKLQEKDSDMSPTIVSINRSQPRVKYTVEHIQLCLLNFRFFTAWHARIIFILNKRIKIKICIQ